MGIEKSAGVRSDARSAIAGALVIAILWVLALSGYALAAPGLASDFRTHLLFGLTMFCAIIVLPLFLVLLTLNWIVRRIAGVLIALLFFGMVRGALGQGFGLYANLGIVFVVALLVGGMLYFLSRPSVMVATGDYYDFVNLHDILSKYTFQRKPRE